MKNPIIDELADNGWEVVSTNRHVKMRHPCLGNVIIPSTGSDWRGDKNLRSLIRRKYREAGLPNPFERSK